MLPGYEGLVHVSELDNKKVNQSHISFITHISYLIHFSFIFYILLMFIIA